MHTPLHRFFLPLFVLMGLHSAVEAQIYRCETESGVPLYQNAPAPRCKPMQLPAITTVPAPSLPGSALPQPQGRSLPPGANPSSGVSPPSFPRVDAASQRARDSDRRSILEDELKREEARLNDLRLEFNNGSPERKGDERNYQKYLDRVQRLKDEISRKEGSVVSLKRELSLLRD